MKKVKPDKFTTQDYYSQARRRNYVTDCGKEYGKARFHDYGGCLGWVLRFYTEVKP